MLENLRGLDGAACKEKRGCRQSNRGREETNTLRLGKFEKGDDRVRMAGDG